MQYSGTRRDFSNFEQGVQNMKKLLAITLTLASFVVMGFGGQASAATMSVTHETTVAAPQWRNRSWRNRSYRSRVRTYRTSRIVRYGFRTYRETYLVRYLPNGRTQTTLINRVRIA